MGLENSNEKNKTYVNVVGSHFAISVKEGTEGAVARENKEKKVVHELLYNSMTGVHITSIKKTTHDKYGAGWEVILKEVDQEYILRLPYSGRVTNGLLFRLPNIDFTQPVALKLFTNKEDKTFLTVYDQDDTKIDAAYSKDNANGMPPLEQKMKKGVMAWDDEAQMSFVENMINTIIIPKLTAMNEFQQPEPTASDSIDDLPF